jgi:C4-dicarboxylate-specific signal transduction histidine kinase
MVAAPRSVLDVIKRGGEEPGARPVALLDRLRLFEKTLLPLVFMATLFAITVGLGVAALHRTVASYREILSHNAPAVLRIERLNALTDEIGYSVTRNLTFHCQGEDAARCARSQSNLDAAAAEGEQRLDEAVRFDPAYRADYERFRQAFHAIVAPARTALALGMKGDDARAEATMAPVHARILVLSDELFRYSSQRITDDRAQGLRLAASAGATERTMILVGVLVAILGLWVAIWVGFAEMTIPVLRLCGRMAQLADGDLDTPVADQRRRDEIGKMARAVQVFKDNAHARLAAEAQVELARNAAVQATRDAQAEVARVARVLSVGELASSISHEINQPIAAIVANGQTALHWLELEPPDLERARAATQRTIRDATRASAIVARVRGMLAKTDQQFVALDLNAVIEEALSFIEDERLRAEVSISTRLLPDPPRVMGDPIQLQQVVLNLVMNGFEAMREAPAPARLLFVSASATGPRVVEVTVEDRGAGIDPEAIERVFEPFFTTKLSGVGLGLSITRSIIQAHGGRIRVEAADPNGARFRFTLPTA